MKNIVCVKWGKKFDSSYVNKLFNAVNRNCTIFDRFICFTDDKVGLNSKIETFELTRSDLEICWNKLILFEKRLYDLEGTILFFDLDVIIKDNIDDLFNYKKESIFISIKEWYGRDYGMYLKKGFPAFNGSIMRFEMGNLSYVIDDFYKRRSHFTEEKLWDRALGYNGKVIYHDLINLPPVVFYGDQEWTYYILTQKNEKIEYYPSEWITSYKLSESHDNSKVVVFHGVPKPNEVDDDFVKEHWK